MNIRAYTIRGYDETREDHRLAVDLLDDFATKAASLVARGLMTAEEVTAEVENITANWPSYVTNSAAHLEALAVSRYLDANRAGSPIVNRAARPAVTKGWPA